MAVLQSKTWRLARRRLMHVIGLAGVLMTALGLMSATIRSSIPILVDRQVARVWPFTYVVVGDSLAALCPWKWSFGLSPVAVANLAVSGSDVRGVTHQINLADQFRPQVILISGGLNDLINYEAPLDTIRYDFTLLLRRGHRPSRPPPARVRPGSRSPGLGRGRPPMTCKPSNAQSEGAATCAFPLSPPHVFEPSLS